MNKRTFLKRIIGAGVASVAVSKLPVQAAEKSVEPPEEELEVKGFSDIKRTKTMENDFVVMTVEEEVGVLRIKKPRKPYKFRVYGKK